MRALVLSDGGVELVENHAPPNPASGILIDVIQAGICETDLQLIKGYKNFSGILGHEFVGIAQSGRFAGQRVCGEINCPCGQCDLCNMGHGNHCPMRSVLGILNHDGAFADQIVLPEANLHAVPDSVSNDDATLVEPLAAAMQLAEQIDLATVRSAIVLGAGRLGNLSAQVLATNDCEVCVVGKHAKKLAVIEQYGLQTCTLPDSDQLVAADLVIDCTGSNSGLETALRLVRPRGTIALKTTIAADHQLSLAPIVINEITLLGSRCGPFDKALAAIESGTFQLDNFISARFKLENHLTAFQRAGDSDALKIVLEP